MATSEDFFAGLPTKRVEGAYGLRIRMPHSTTCSCAEMAEIVTRILVTHHVVEGDGPRHMQKLEVYRGTDDAMMVWVISTKEAASE